MEKVVKLLLEYDSQFGYDVELVEIKEEGEQGRTLAEGVTGNLPHAYSLFQDYRDWWDKYEKLDELVRVLNKPVASSSGKSVIACQEAAETVKESFNQWLDFGGFHKIENSLRTNLSKKDYIRFLIKSDDERLSDLPWNTWDFFEDYRYAEVGWSFTEFRGQETSVGKNGKNAVSILAVVSAPNSPEKLADFQDETRWDRVDAETEYLQDPFPRQVRDRLWDGSWDILLIDKSGESEGETLEWQTVNLASFHNSLKTAVDNGLKLAIVNGKNGIEVGRQLVVEHQMSTAIAVRYPVPEEFIREFFHYFMVEYAMRKHSLYVAIRKARDRLADEWREKLPNVDWLLSVFQNPTKKLPSWRQLYGGVTPKQVAVASMVCTVLVMCARMLGMLQGWELAAFDSMMRMRPPEEPDNRLLVVAITERDIQNSGEYPVSDRTLTQVLDKLMEYKPTAVGLDLFRNRPQNPGYPEFSTHLHRNDRLVTICQPGDRDDPDSIAISPPPRSLKNRVGFSKIVVDADGIVRRHLVSLENPGRECSISQAFSTKLAHQYFQDREIDSPFAVDGGQWGKKLGPRLANRRGFYARLDTKGEQLLLNYRNREQVAPQVSLTEILNDEIQSDAIANRIVLIGYTAPSVGNTFSTPYGFGRNQQIPTVVLHAQMVSQVVSAVLDDRPLLWFLPLWGDVVWVGLWSGVGGAIVWQCRKNRERYLGVIMAIALLFGACFVSAMARGVCLPLVPAAIALVTTSASAIAASSVPERWAVSINFQGLP
ncbi:CHASE2 domain-containing protein [Phormidium sp. CCY1219]|uniref:CHASE2 domain-containing protein n=1 Tax=Phormidium sp. CCY1219 TaxID=2886104 RepID=UPI002D1EC027|nr:CHASE2 domain-containing protein [Phormidium sp. CCY1219]MEB3829440.1 CHASE2 domain-containing protein [Phormidium sp. CCY1219]